MNLATPTWPLSAIQCAGLCPYSSLEENASFPWRSCRYSTWIRDLKREKGYRRTSIYGKVLYYGRIVLVLNLMV